MESQTQTTTATYSQVTSAVAIWYQQQQGADDYSDSDDENSKSTCCPKSHSPQDEDDASASIDSFVMRRMQFSALEKWQSNRSLTSVSPTKDIVLLGSSAADVESDLEDDDDTIASISSSSKKKKSGVLLERPLPVSIKSKSTGVNKQPLKKSTLRRIKSDCSSTTVTGSNKKKKTLMRKVVSDVDKVRQFTPNSKILDDNSDRWDVPTCTSTSSSNSGDCKKKNHRVAGLLLQKTNSRSLSPRLRTSSSNSTATDNKKEVCAAKQRRKLARAVSDLGSKRTLSIGGVQETTSNKANSTFPTATTTTSSSKKQTDRRRMIQESVNAVAARASSSSSSPSRKGCRPSIADIRTMMEQCHPNHPALMDLCCQTNSSKHTTKTKTETKKKKSISRCLSENDAPDSRCTLKTSKSCHSRLISLASATDEPSTTKKEKKTQSVTTTTTTTTTRSSNSGSKRQGSVSPSPPPKTTLRRGLSQGNSAEESQSSTVLGSSKSCHNRMISPNSSPSSSSSSSSSSSVSRKSSRSSSSPKKSSSTSQRRRSRSTSPKKNGKHTTKDTLSLPPPDFRWELFNKPSPLQKSPPTPPPQAMAA